MSIKLKKGIGNGGNGDETTDYTSLTNKPQINGVELNGNKTSENLGLVPAPKIVTNPSASGLAVKGNTIYKFGTALTSLTISSVETSDYESIIYFTTGAGTITLSVPNTLRWGGGSAPELESNTVYCIAIRNGLAEIDNFGSAS